MTTCSYLIDSLNPDIAYDHSWMVPVDECYETMKKGFIGEINLICGPSLVGKTGFVYWLKGHNPDFEIIKVDCLFHSTHMSFIGELVS